MLTKTAIEHFGSQAEICRALDISSAAVAKWGEVVPIEAAMALEILSDKSVTVDHSRYPKLARALESNEQRANKRTNA